VELQAYERKTPAELLENLVIVHETGCIGFGAKIEGPSMVKKEHNTILIDSIPVPVVCQERLWRQVRRAMRLPPRKETKPAR
jgi:hypothetical protein